ncbi:sulfatase-like hydrolase/transferase [Opitutales bacterium]|nr:sulfatase-like hydrolase/transferase [Opitutales bacterium]
MNRWVHTVSFFLFGLSLGTVSVGRPNILVILSDDQRADHLGVNGHPVLRTPNLDHLAEEGINFRNAFASSTACTPNRTCILTGQYERKHGVNFNSGSLLKEEAWQRTYPMLLKKAGYYVGYVGKNHTPIGKSDRGVGYQSGVMEGSFNYWYGNHNHSTFYPKSKYPIYLNARANSQVEIFTEGALNFLSEQNGFASASEFLKSRPLDQPFCLLVNLNVPHNKGTSTMRLLPKDPGLYKSAYRDQIENLPVPATYLAEHEIKQPKLPSHVYNGKYLGSYDYVKSRADLRERMVRVCQTVEGVDRMVGSLLGKLQQDGVADKTVTFFTSDHGIQHGEHGLGGKVLLYEESLRVPMIVHDPRIPQEHRGRVSEELVLSIDLAPTILELAGLPADEEMQGMSLIPLMHEKSIDWRCDFFAENLFTGQNYPRIEAVREKEFKYIRYFSKSHRIPYRKLLLASIEGESPTFEELYDLSKDPYEKKNLVGAKDYRMDLVRLRKRCQQLVIQAKGSLRYPLTIPYHSK